MLCVVDEPRNLNKVRIYSVKCYVIIINDLKLYDCY